MLIFMCISRFRLVKQGGGSSLSLCSATFCRWFAQILDRLRLRLEEDVRGEKTIYARIVMDLRLRQVHGECGRGRRPSNPAQHNCCKHHMGGVSAYAHLGALLDLLCDSCGRCLGLLALGWYGFGELRRY